MQIFIAFLFQTLRLELSLVPVEEAAQKQHMLHPNLLSVNIKEQNRIKFKSDLTSAQAWKVVLWIKNGDVLYQDPVTGTVYTIDKLFEGNKILLGKKINTILVNFSPNFELIFQEIRLNLEDKITFS